MQAASTCGRSRKAVWVSPADLASSKATAAVLFSAMIRASAERSRRNCCRNQTVSSTRKERPESSSARAVVARIATSSFRSIGMSRNGRILVAAASTAGVTGDFERARNDPQSRAAGRRLIDVAPNPFVFQNPADGAADGQKVRGPACRRYAPVRPRDRLFIGPREGGPYLALRRGPAAAGSPCRQLHRFRQRERRERKVFEGGSIPRRGAAE